MLFLVPHCTALCASSLYHAGFSILELYLLLLLLQSKNIDVVHGMVIYKIK